ncbi:Crp/Fnr family transcriptional regulator [Dactylosporangium cerinum]|uniref:Crp/Fnr family transcriptional regulator n=1 Tax=Dactylosporangium cerinum TaxID=1434730 RepID=A0ABV9WE79_9ACTN
MLAGLSEADRSALLALGSVRRHAAGSVLMHEGDPGADLHVMLHGCVKVVGDTDDGRTTLLAVRVPGDLIGELAALDGRPRSATVIAAAATMTRSVDHDTFEAFLAQRRGAATVVQRSITTKLREATRFRTELGGASVPVRIVRVLHHLAQLHGRAVDGGLLVDVPLSQPEIAALAGVSAPGARRALTDLRRRDIVSTGYRRLLVRDPAALGALAADTGREPGAHQ